MIIMQTLDAMARRRYIESNKLAKVIFAHELEDSVCIQYHPRGIFGRLSLSQGRKKRSLINRRHDSGARLSS